MALVAERKVPGTLFMVGPEELNYLLVGKVSEERHSAVSSFGIGRNKVPLSPQRRITQEMQRAIVASENHFPKIPNNSILKLQPTFSVGQEAFVNLSKSRQSGSQPECCRTKDILQPHMFRMKWTMVGIKENFCFQLEPYYFFYLFLFLIRVLSHPEQRAGYLAMWYSCEV